MELNGTYQLMVWADDVNLLGKNVTTIKKNTEALLDISIKVGFVVNAQFMSANLNAGQNHCNNS
jgi:hypothetical protein